MTREKKHWATLVLFVVICAAETVAMALQPQFVKSILDNLSTGGGLRQPLVGFAVCIAIIIVLEYCGQLLQAKFEQQVFDVLRTNLLNSFASINVPRLSADRRGALVSGLNKDIPVVYEEYYGSILVIAMRTLQVMIMSIGLLSLRWEYFALIIAGSLCTLIIPKLFVKGIERRRLAALDASHKLNTVFSDFTSAFTDIRLAKAVLPWTRRVREQSMAHTRAEWNLGVFTAGVNVTVGFTFFMSQLGLVVLAAFLISSGQSSVGAFVAASQYAQMLVSPIQGLAGAINRLNSGRVAVKAFSEAFPPIPQGGREFGILPRFESLDFSGVIASYDGGTSRIALPDFSLKRGEKVCLSGQNGVGKSTIFEVLTGGAEVIEGSVLVNGAPIHALSIPERLSMFGYAVQSPHMVSDTVCENVTLGRDSDSARVAEVAAVVGISARMSEDDANALSGGQKQRVSLARVLVRDADVILLDEALSQIDGASRSELFEKLVSNGDKTILAVSHNHSDHAYFNRIEEFM